MVGDRQVGTGDPYVEQMALLAELAAGLSDVDMLIAASEPPKPSTSAQVSRAGMYRPIVDVEQLQVFARHHGYPEPALIGSNLWDSLYKAWTAIAAAQTVLQQPIEARVMLAGRERSADEVRHIGAYGLRFVERSDQPGELGIDLQSLHDFVRRLQARGYDALPKHFPDIGPRRVSLMAHFVSEGLRLDNPLPRLPGYPPAIPDLTQKVVG